MARASGGAEHASVALTVNTPVTITMLRSVSRTLQTQKAMRFTSIC